MANRPEFTGPPEIFYDESEANKYTYNSRIMEIQEKMCERAIELLLLPEDKTCLLLDIGCGSGLSGSVLEEHGHRWIGIDISSAMLKVARDRDVEGDLLLSDMGQGLPFKPASFDGAISISALQWLCNIDKSSHLLQKRLNAFFGTLFACLSSGARAVFQFYPQGEEQINLLTMAATRAGFFGGTIIDYPNSKKAKKFFLVLMTSGAMTLPKALDHQEENEQTIRYSRKRSDPRCKSRTDLKSRKQWVMEKKEKRRRQGKGVALDSKYSGRKRHTKF